MSEPSIAAAAALTEPRHSDTAELHDLVQTGGHDLADPLAPDSSGIDGHTDLAVPAAETPREEVAVPEIATEDLASQDQKVSSDDSFTDLPSVVPALPAGPSAVETAPEAPNTEVAEAQTAPEAPSADVVLTGITAQLGELLRLRTLDVNLADRLYTENTRLRTGELAGAMAPLLSGLLRLHDQMSSLASGDTHSVPGMLRTQLLQILDTHAGLTPFVPESGDRFDSSRHAGAGRARTSDAAKEDTVSQTLKPGFRRADGSIVRVAEVEVYRLDAR
jgi:molecular chaperone GrpE (heat shock protein)